MRGEDATESTWMSIELEHDKMVSILFSEDGFRLEGFSMSVGMKVRIRHFHIEANLKMKGETLNPHLRNARQNSGLRVI